MTTFNTVPLIKPLEKYGYSRYLPSAYDSSMSVYEELVTMREYLNQVILSQNEVLEQWHVLKKWLDETIEQYVKGELEEMLESGELADILNQLIGIIGDYKNYRPQDPTVIDKIMNGFNEREVNVKDWGVKGDYDPTELCGTDDTEKLNFVLDKYRGYTVYIPDGKYLISADLVIHSNTHLKLSKNAEIFAINGMGKAGTNPNHYDGIHMIKNHKETGLENVRITGGMWNGNGHNQFHDSMRGIFIQKCVGVVLDDIKVKEVNGWAFSVSNSRNIRATNIELDQLELIGENGDGVHMLNSSDIYIDNISGFTNDDLVAIDAGDILSPIESVKNVIIRNLRPKMKGTTNCYKAVALYCSSNQRMDNVLVDGIMGDTHAPIVIIANARAQEGMGYFGNITITNVSGNCIGERQPFNIQKYNQPGNASAMFIDNLTISNYKRVKPANALDDQPILLLQSVDIKNFNISNIDDQYSGDTGRLMRSFYANVENLKIENYNRKQLVSSKRSDSAIFAQGFHVDNFVVSGWNDYTTGNATPLLELDILCNIKNMIIDGVSRTIVAGPVSPFTGLLFIHGTTYINTCVINNTTVVFRDTNSAPLVYQYGEVNVMQITNSKCYSDQLPNPIVLYIMNQFNADGNETLLQYSNVYSGIYHKGNPNVGLTKGKLRVRGFDAIIDPTKITAPKEGDFILGTDSKMKQFDGTQWNNL
ncbi:pre-neck appendage protein [Bacillus phage MG-B1]|uniref:Pre-neck appendage protein n=1 Tax=Bacillus phage MG-B1 TaxID=1309583 RepID=M4WNJ8_9CAUD|nr:tail spike protein [Bacillus phage MG-B1]AGI10621.1 pre-neck appendage protein [Bacillus phage MG-B1]